MHRLLTCFLIISSTVVASAAPVWVTPKHRAAPPQEMLPGAPLAPVSPADVPLWSRSAMLRIDLDPDATWQGTLPIDAPGDLRIIALSQAGDDLTLTLHDTTQSAPIHLSPDTKDALAQTTEIPLDGFAPHTGYIIPVQQPGAWNARITAPRDTRTVYLLYATDAPRALRSARTTDRTLVNEPITFRASIHDTKDAPATHSDAAFTMLVTTPDDRILTIPMKQNEFADKDATYSASFTPDRPGRYLVQTIARSDTFLRTAQHTVSVVPADITLQNSATAATLQDNRTLRIDISATDHDRTEHTRLTAQLWGHNAQGDSIPVCWIGGMTFPHLHTPTQATLSLDLDTRWIARANAVPPFELRHVEVRCPRTMALLSQADTIPLTLDALLPRVAAPAVITPDMRTAPRNDAHAFPVEINLPHTPRLAGGHNLLLIHGYCAGGNPWPLSDYTGALEIFSDPNANRSHDDFALLIKALGDTTKSFGVVAHSQGGCASLHLYTYYFSGLDWAQGPRLIQSLGTPYQGTPLAGSLAGLGQIFGSGCGTNTDLSVDGAAIWLSGIPNDARARVHYWTTSFTSGWCNFLSGLILSNPEDGVVEVARGQLPGANNMGNTVGQCHTTGMSDPAQYLDSSRNSEMNANAAR